MIVTGVEHDHIDIYPDEASYAEAFAELLRAVPEGGLVVCDASQKLAVRLAQEHARARVVYYALDGDDTGDVTPTWLGAYAPVDPGGMQPFDLFIGGTSDGRYTLKVPGRHNVRNAIGAVAACAEGFGVPLARARVAMATFEGVRRRQDLLGIPRGVRVYDDFAHHPTAVDETLRAFRAKHPQGTLWAVFEPRSRTACSALHQDAYPQAFAPADRVLIAPLGRAGGASEGALDVQRLAADIGEKARAMPTVDAILACLVAEVRPGDTVALLSNGAFAGLHTRLLRELSPSSGDVSAPALRGA